MDRLALAPLLKAAELSIPSSKSTGGAVARSAAGIEYAAGSVSTQTHLLQIPPELAALVRAVHAGDPVIASVSAITEDPSPSPLVLKLLADHAIRTGNRIAYKLYRGDGTVLLNTDDVFAAMPFYKTSGSQLSKLYTKRVLAHSNPRDLVDELRQAARLGMTCNFPTRDGASGYGASVRTKDGQIFFGGQYSTYEHRLGVHAEMAVLLNAFMSGANVITHIGIASSKFPDTPCSPCGACRQFIAEMAHIYECSPRICLFASEADVTIEHSIEDLLPLEWSSRR